MAGFDAGARGSGMVAGAMMLVTAAAIAGAQVPPRSVALGVGGHFGNFGDRVNGGVAVSAAGWRRIAPFAAVRADASYAYKVSSRLFACNAIDLPCPPGPPKHLPAIGVSTMLGALAGDGSRAYVVAGGEVMFVRNDGEAPGQIVVPKLGIGRTFPEKIFLEVTGRWRSDWGGRPLRHIILVAGWYR